MFIDILEERRLLDAKTTLIDEVDYIVNAWHDNKYKGVILCAYVSHTSCHVSISNTNCEMEIVVPS
jgi:hypothetical protein